MPRLVVLTLLVPMTVLAQPAASYGAAPTCHGTEATVVGTPGGNVVGTDGNDVIVSEGAMHIDARAGDDLICVTRGAGQLAAFVQAGTGDDQVDTTAAALPVVETSLGPGVDAFLGGVVHDIVSADDSEDVVDSIATGGGDDKVVVGRRGGPTNDVVDLGEGRDSIDVQGLPGDGSINGGAGGDSIRLVDRTGAEWKIDNRKQTIAADGTMMPLLDIERFQLNTLRFDSLRLVGGAEGESVVLGKSPRSSSHHGGVLIDMGRGDDVLELGPDLTGPYHGGAGDDQLLVVRPAAGGSASAAITADFTADVVRVGGGDDAKVTSFTDLTLRGFDRNLVRMGAGQGNALVYACRATVYAGAGADEVRLVRRACKGTAPKTSLLAYGEGGDDTLISGGMATTG